MKQYMSGEAASRRFALALAFATAAGIPTAIHAQRASGDAMLDSLMTVALAGNADLAAASARADAARNSIAPAGARPDPMLMLGVVNVPLRHPGFTEDDMTMKVVGISQEILYPGKLGLMRKAAAAEAAQAELSRDSVRLAVIRQVRAAYYEIAYIDAAIDVARQTHATLRDIATVAERRYASGKSEQQDVIRASLEATRVNETVNGLATARVAAVSSLSTLTGSTIGPYLTPRIPESILRIAGSSSPDSIRFRTAALGSSAVGLPLLPLPQVLELALAHNPGARALRLSEDLARFRVELAEKNRLPDFNVSLEYGQRSGRSMENSMRRDDMISVSVSMPLPINQSSRQRPIIRSAIAESSSASAERRARENMLRADVARLYSEAERDYTLIALYRKALLPQGRAAVSSSTDAYRSGTGSFTSILEAQSTLLELESGYQRAVSDFAQRMAELEEITGAEVIR